MRRFIAIGLIGIGGLAACSSADDAVTDKIKDAAKDKGVNIDENNGKVTVEGKNGKGSLSFGEGADLPEGFPSDDVPLPKGGEVAAVITSERDGKELYSITYRLDTDDLQSAADDYKSQLADAGFEITSSTSFGGESGSFSGFRAESADWEVVVSAGSGSGESKGAFSIIVSSVT